MYFTATKILNAPTRISELGIGKYLARVLKHFGIRPNKRFFIVKVIKTMIEPIVYLKSRKISKFISQKPEDLSISKATHVLHVPRDVVLGVDELVSSIAQFYELNKDTILKRTTGPYSYLISLLKKPSDRLHKNEKVLLRKILSFAAQPSLIGLAAEYIGQIPVIHSYSLTRTGATAGEASYTGSQLFHRDVGEKNLLHMIVTVSETTTDSGPFTYIDAINSKKVLDQLGHQAGRVSDADVMDIVGDDQLVELIETPGSVIFINPERCFHYGARNQKDERIQLIISYAPPNEAIEGGTALYLKKYRKEFDASELTTAEKRLLKIY